MNLATFIIDAFCADKCGIKARRHKTVRDEKTIICEHPNLDKMLDNIARKEDIKFLLRSIMADVTRKMREYDDDH